MRTVVIRLSSLGDITLCGAVTASLAPVTFVTKPRYKELAAALVGVEEVLCPPDDPLPKQASGIVDLQNSPASRLLSARIKGPVRRVARHGLRRRIRVWFKTGAPPPKVVKRYSAAARAPISPRPWVLSEGPRDTLIICPTAQHATKVWPAEKYVRLAAHWDGPVLLLGGPGDKRLFRRMVDGIGPKCDSIAEDGFNRTLQALGRGKVAVGGDSGLLHLCAAAEIPVVGIFGPTRSDDGFWCHRGVPVETDLPCRPCSRFGSGSCPIGDHLCMSSIEVGEVARAVHLLSL